MAMSIKQHMIISIKIHLEPILPLRHRDYRMHLRFLISIKMAEVVLKHGALGLHFQELLYLLLVYLYQIRLLEYLKTIILLQKFIQ